MTGLQYTMWIDGEERPFDQGDTILEVCRRAGREIPTLCHDPRLEPYGACRLCLVEVEGVGRLVPACAAQAEPEMKVVTKNERIIRHREVLLSLYQADLPDGGESLNDDRSDTLYRYIKSEGRRDYPKLDPLREGREDRNAFIAFQAERCILCGCCTRYCAEVEGVQAISLAYRGPATTISTPDNRSLLNTTCEMCGGCIDVCPTGAMIEKQALCNESSDTPFAHALNKVRTTCAYCGVGCQLDLEVDPAGNDGRGRVVRAMSPAPGTTTNDGNLCVKGRFAYSFIDHPDRLTTPKIRGDDGELHDATWEAALQKAAGGLLRIQEQSGPDALGFVSSSRCTGEENYLMQKLSRAVFNTNNVHQCAAT